MTKPTIAYFSAYPLDADCADSIRARYFIEELEKFFDIAIFSGRLPPVNNRPIIFRLVGEALSGFDISVRLICTGKKSVFCILSSPPYITALIAAISLALFGRKYVLDIRDPYPEVLFGQGLCSRDSLIGRALVWLTNRIYRKASGICAATEGIKDIIGRTEANDKLITVFNGFDPSLFFPLPLEEKFQRFTLVCHGNFAKMQNVDLLIEIAKRCPEDIDILVAGWGPGVKKIKDEGRITFLGRAAQEETAGIVRRAHVGLSLRNDGLVNKVSFPVKVFEYIGAALPVISTPKESEAGRFLEDNALGYRFGTDDIENIMERILWLKENPPSHPQRLEGFFRRSQAGRFAEFIARL